MSVVEIAIEVDLKLTQALFEVYTAGAWIVRGVLCSEIEVAGTGNYEVKTRGKARDDSGSFVVLVIQTEYTGS